MDASWVHFVTVWLSTETRLNTSNVQISERGKEHPCQCAANAGQPMSSYSICLGNWNMLKIKRNYFRIFFGEHPIEKLEITEVQKFRSSFPVPARPDQMNAPGEFYIFKSRYDSRYRLTASQSRLNKILSKGYGRKRSTDYRDALIDASATLPAISRNSLGIDDCRSSFGCFRSSATIT